MVTIIPKYNQEMQQTCTECAALRRAVMDATEAAIYRGTSGEAAKRTLIAIRSANFSHAREHIKQRLGRP